QAKNRHPNGQGRWPIKSAGFILDLLKNAETETHLPCVVAAYMSSPCHIELTLSEKEEPVKKEPDTQIAASKPKKA
ncbi:hypothetical protein BHE74_00024930, partial [Ensete ventricosum]